MAALGGGGILYEMCKKAMITKNYKVNNKQKTFSFTQRMILHWKDFFTMFRDIRPGQVK